MNCCSTQAAALPGKIKKVFLNFGKIIVAIIDHISEPLSAGGARPDLHCGLFLVSSPLMTFCHRALLRLILSMEIIRGVAATA